MTVSTHEHDAAALHDCTRHMSHPDSEEAVQIERQRFAQELEPLGHHITSKTTSHTSSQHEDTPSRTRQTSNISSAASNAPLQDRDSLEIYATTPQDVTRSQGTSIREVRWYGSVVKFWKTHVRYISKDIMLDRPSNA